MDSSDSLHKSLSINLEERKVSNNLEEDLNNFTEKANNTLMDKLKKVPALGMIFGILSAIFQLGMFYNVKVLYNTTTLTSFEVIFIRGITDLTLTLIIWHFIGVDVIKIQKESRNPIKVRMFFAIASAFFIFLAYKVNPLSIATLLTYTSPIFTSIFAFFLLGEKMTKYDFINIVSCWIGVVLITNPFGTTGTAITLYGIIIGAFSSITMAGSFTMVRMVSITFHYFVPMFYYSLATTAFAPIAYMIMILFGHPATVLTSNEWIRIIHSAIKLFFFNYCNINYFWIYFSALIKYILQARTSRKSIYSKISTNCAYFYGWCYLLWYFIFCSRNSRNSMYSEQLYFTTKWYLMYRDY